MKELVWRVEYSVGNSEIDQQHSCLLATMAQIRDAILDGEGHLVVGSYLRELEDYASTHFATEEHYMQSIGFPDFVVHKAEHENFLVRLSDYTKAHARGELTGCVRIYHFLLDWISNHLVQSDMKYAAFARHHAK